MKYGALGTIGGICTSNWFFGGVTPGCDTNKTTDRWFRADVGFFFFSAQKSFLTSSDGSKKNLRGSSFFMKKTKKKKNFFF